MAVFLDRDVKQVFVAAVAVLLGFIVLGQAVICLVVADFKRNLIEHDSEIAGYLSRSGLPESRIAYTFTSEKTEDDLRVGSELLQAAGYSGDVQTGLLPRVTGFHQKYAAVMLALSAVFSSAVLGALLALALKREKRVEAAIEDVKRIGDGDPSVRLDDRGEGSLARLFASINGVATTLTSYVIKERQSKEFLKDAISDISHQLKTPLAALRVYNEIIQNERTGNDVVESFAAKSERELDRMETLTKNLLKLARLDVGLVEIEKRNHNLKAFLEDCLEGFRTRADLEGKTIGLDCADHITLSFDDEWLLEAVSNIVKNALDHSGPGDRINIICRETPVVTEITIEDSGRGIHPEDVHHIFKRFYRSRLSKDKQGIGIGLALSKSIVELHGGSIIVESELGKGSAFRMVFPKLSNL